MKLASVIREAGIPTQNFKKCPEIPITLYEEDDRIDTNDDIKYRKKLFEHNAKSLLNFYDFLKELERQPTQPTSINVMIDEHYVIVFYKTPHARSFFRKEPLNPMDFMD